MKLEGLSLTNDKTLEKTTSENELKMSEMTM